MSWSGLPEHPIANHNYTIDGNQVVNEVDFYCLLGEAFFGYRGYFGQDSHGLKDCFAEIYLHNPEKPLVEPGATVTVFNHQALCEVLNEIDEDYASYLVGVFKQNGFEVIMK